MFQGETSCISVLQRRYEASQRMLARVMRENRVRDECLELAMKMLRHYASFTVHAAQKTVDEIERRLAQLEPEEEADPCEGCGNQGTVALFGNSPASGNSLCRACEGYKEEAG